MGELVLRPVAISEISIEVARFRTDRRHHVAGFVATLTLVAVGDDVVIGPRAAVDVNPAHVNGVAGDVECGLGLGIIPDVRQTDPAIGLAFEDPGLDQATPLRRVARITRIGERLGDHGADREFECVERPGKMPACPAEV